MKLSKARRVCNECGKRGSLQNPVNFSQRDGRYLHAHCRPSRGEHVRRQTNRGWLIRKMAAKTKEMRSEEP